MKTRFLAFVLVWLSALLLLASNQARARDGPLIPSQHNPPFVPASPKPEPPLEIPLPEKLPKVSNPTPPPDSEDVFPKPSTRPPIFVFLGDELVDLFRMERIFDCGSTANECLRKESDALILARIAMGESPDNFQDRVYVMWNIKMRAALGFKEAGYYSGYRNMEARWGPETSIKTEALCDGGCQYSPARVADGIYYPCLLSAGHPIRAMLCPTDEQLVGFYVTYLMAEDIVNASIWEMPEELRGYDSFRSPLVAGVGRKHREGGLPSQQFFPRANIWQDEYDKDNVFWFEWR